MTLDVWIKSKYCTSDNKSPITVTLGGFVKVKIPEYCDDCFIENTILHSGDEFSETSFADCCRHYATYPKVWKNRIKTAENVAVSTNSSTVEPTLMHCNKCGYPNNYGVPNVGDKYVCGFCR